METLVLSLCQKRAFLLCTIFILLSSCESGADNSSDVRTLYIDRLGSPTSTSCTQANPCTFLSTALSLATPGTVIHVAPGSYSGAQQNVDLNITVNDITINGIAIGAVFFTCPTTTSTGGWSFGSNVTQFAASNISFSHCTVAIQASGMESLILNGCQNTVGYGFLSVSNSAQVNISGYSDSYAVTRTELPSVITASSIKNMMIVGCQFSSYTPHLTVSNTTIAVTTTVFQESSSRSFSATSSSITLSGVTWQSNKRSPSSEPPDSKILGGAMYLGQDSVMRATNVSFIGNAILQDASLNPSVYGGAAYFDAGVTATLVNCIATSNQVEAAGDMTAYGGAFAVNSSSVTFENSLISGNEAECGVQSVCNDPLNIGGGAFYCINNGNIAIAHSNVTKNVVVRAGDNGGGFVMCGTPCIVSSPDSTVSGNTDPALTTLCTSSDDVFVVAVEQRAAESRECRAKVPKERS